MFLIVRVFPTSKREANVTINDSIFQQSSPIRHVVELLAINKRFNRKPEAFTLVFMDGGSDQNNSVINMELSWLAYFILACADSLVVGRTTPTQIWTNLAERVMSDLDLALSNSALARKIMGDEFENNMKKSNNMGSVRKMVEHLDSVALAVVVAFSAVGANNDVVANEVVIPPMEVEIIVNACDIGKMAPKFDLSQELREHMTEVDGDLEDHLPMDDDTVTAQVIQKVFGSHTHGSSDFRYIFSDHQWVIVIALLARMICCS